MGGADREGEARRYLGRDDGYGPKEWYTLCDAPYGYCERDCHVREDITLIVCDKDWNEVLRDGTDRERFPESFPHWMKPATRHGARS